MRIFGFLISTESYFFFIDVFFHLNELNEREIKVDSINYK